MDLHANTYVAAGPNFRIDECTEKHCDVTPYSTEYKPILDFPIVNASTAFTDKKNGQMMILQFKQVLWYGKKLGMRLINPNQLRHCGHTVSDNTTDRQTRKFGIAGEDFLIPSRWKERQSSSTQECQHVGKWKIAV
jgi:hypothetical protein